MINKIIGLLAASLTVGLTAFAQEAPLDLSVTLSGYTPEVSIVDGSGNPLSSFTFPQINSDSGVFTAISEEITVEVAHSRNARVIVYSDDPFSSGVNPENILGLKRSGTSADTTETPNPDQVVLKVFVTEVFTNNSIFGPYTVPSDLSDERFLFVRDLNSSTETVLMNAVNNAQSYVKFVFGINATNSVPDTYIRSLKIESILE